jgi:hypothetical protein
MLEMLTSAAVRTKRLVSSASIRALLLTSDYQTARNRVIPEAKRDNWKRIGEQEFMPLCIATDAAVSTLRATVRTTVVLRILDIASQIPDESNTSRMILEALAEMLADLEIKDFDDSI